MEYKYVFLNDHDTFTSLEGSLLVVESGDGLSAGCGANRFAYDLAAIIAATDLSKFSVKVPESVHDSLDEDGDSEGEESR